MYKLIFMFALASLFLNRTSATPTNGNIGISKSIYPELTDWLTNNQSTILKESKFFKVNATVVQENDLFKKILLDPTMATKIWNEITKKMEGAHASPSAIKQAKIYSTALGSAKISISDRKTLAMIIDKTDGINNIQQVESIISENVSKGSLSKDIGNRMINNIHAGEPVSFNRNKSNIHFATVLTYSSPTVMPTRCIVAYCVPLWGLLAFAFKACRS